MKLTLVYGQSDWYALYIDGQRFDQAHSPQIWRVLSLLVDVGEPITELSSFTLDDKQEARMLDEAELPMTLEELEGWK